MIATVAVVLGGAAADAHAQPAIPAGTWLASASAGMVFDDDPDQEQDVSAAVAGAVGVTLTAHVAVEADLGYVFDLAVDEPGVDPSLATAHGSLLYLFASELQAAPYVAAGVGAGRFSARTATGVNVGGGVILVHRADVWLRADLRYFHHERDVPAAWRVIVGLTFFRSS